MNNKRKYIMATILFLAVGAASITTSLFITGNTNISINDDFDVYFSKAVVNGTKDNSVITSSTTINFSAEMQSVGDTYTLEYDVTNASKNYDANVSVSCTNSTDNIKITNEFDTTTNLEATETRTGTLTLKLTQGVSTETTVSIKCEIDASAVERTTIADGIPADEVVLIPVTATDSSGKNLNASSYAITGTTKDTLLEKLVESGNVSSADEVDALIEVESDDFDDLATTTFDVSNIASNGDTVVILHYNETTQEWEYISEETVADGKVTADFSSYSPVAFAVKKSNGTYEVVKGTNLYNLMKANASTDTIDFSVNSGTSGTNGIYITTETEGNVPVYYYRGSYEKINNNLIFNNMCWKILHTTETGGVKLIYNGEPSDGQCTTQTGDATQIAYSEFNENDNDNAYVGYMYGEFDSYYIDNGKSSYYLYTSTSTSSKKYFGTSYTFDSLSGEYTLSGNIKLDNISYADVGYYTCFSETANSSCNLLYYIDYDETSSTIKKIPLERIYHGSTSYNEAHENRNNSFIKTIVDNWYRNNFNDTSITSNIEDTIYCNDRSMVAGGVNNSLTSAYGTLGYGQSRTGYGVLSRSSYSTNELKPSLKCTNANDKFTVESTIGNGALTYPVGLITLDEVALAGYNSKGSNSNNFEDRTNYLYCELNYWTMTPYSFDLFTYDEVGNLGAAIIGSVNSDIISVVIANSAAYVRPVISLKSGTTVTGSGTTTNPYVVS